VTWLAGQRNRTSKDEVLRDLTVRRDEFSGFFAEFYDILHAGLPDVDAYVAYAGKYGPKILELGSGTGRILIPLARAGFQVTGIDTAEDMLSICRYRLECEPEKVQARVRQVKADVIDLDLNEHFDLIIAPCNFMNQLTGPGDALSALRSTWRHLSDLGTFILDNSIPDIPFMVRTNGVERKLDFTHPLTGTTIRDAFTASYDFVRQIETDHIVLEEYTGSKLLRREETESTLTYYFPREIRVMLNAASLEVFHEQGSLVEDVPIDSRSREMIFFCRKVGKQNRN